jgi:hypothetical protein
VGGIDRGVDRFLKTPESIRSATITEYSRHIAN